MDWQPYFTTRLVDDFATHLRVFRKAQDRLADREDKQSKPALSFGPSIADRLRGNETNSVAVIKRFDFF